MPESSVSKKAQRRPMVLSILPAGGQHVFCGSAASMCGKALPFRSVPKFIRGYASALPSIEAQPLGKNQNRLATGKAKPFRTSGGKAAMNTFGFPGTT
jgi:hypothetical protein